MADDKNKIDTPDVPEVVAQEAKTVGDDQVPVREASVQVNKGTVPAQVSQPRESDSSTSQVHEVNVQLDEVITDPSSPLAVQVPDAGRGSLDLPIHRLGEERPEDVFARDAAKSDKK
jgi:hypothetical protein